MSLSFTVLIEQRGLFAAFDVASERLPLLCADRQIAAGRNHAGRSIRVGIAHARVWDDTHTKEQSRKGMVCGEGWLSDLICA